MLHRVSKALRHHRRFPVPRQVRHRALVAIHVSAELSHCYPLIVVKMVVVIHSHRQVLIRTQLYPILTILDLIIPYYSVLPLLICSHLISAFCSFFLYCTEFDFFFCCVSLIIVNLIIYMKRNQ